MAYSTGGGGYLLENLFFLATALGTFVILGWIILRLVAGFVSRCNESLMVKISLKLAKIFTNITNLLMKPHFQAEIRLQAGMRHPCNHSDDKLYHSLLKILDAYL